MTNADLTPEDAKLVTLARATRARTNAAQGAAVRDLDGRTYAGASVALDSLQLGALDVCVAMAIASGSRGLEAAVVLTQGDDVDTRRPQRQPQVRHHRHPQAGRDHRHRGRLLLDLVVDPRREPGGLAGQPDRVPEVRARRRHDPRVLGQLGEGDAGHRHRPCLLYTSPSPRDS